MKNSLFRCLVAEFLGTAFLVAAVVGSGVMGEQLALQPQYGTLGQVANSQAKCRLQALTKFSSI